MAQPYVAKNVKVVWTGNDVIERMAAAQVLKLLTVIGTQYIKAVQLAMRNSPRSGPGVNSRGQKRSGKGEPPAPDHGDLIRRCHFQIRQVGGRTMMEAGNFLRKAAYLEFGAARGRVMQARDLSGKFTKAKTMSWILYPRPVWGPELLRIKSRIPEFVKKLPKTRRF
jgi:hypothetical protein